MNMIILASASPRRKELLQLITDEFEVYPSDCDECLPDGMAITEFPEYIAREKAIAVSHKFPHGTVIGADTGVFSCGEILGKPANEENARDMLKSLSGKTHTVITGCAVVKNGICLSFSQETEVEFYPLTEKEIDDYLLTGEPFDKAGAYGIQGKGGLFVKRINGDYFNVVGLPIAKLKRFLTEMP